MKIEGTHTEKEYIDEIIWLRDKNDNLRRENIALKAKNEILNDQLEEYRLMQQLRKEKQ